MALEVAHRPLMLNRRAEHRVLHDIAEVGRVLVAHGRPEPIDPTDVCAKRCAQAMPPAPAKDAISEIRPSRPPGQEKLGLGPAYGDQDLVFARGALDSLRVPDLRSGGDAEIARESPSRLHAYWASGG